MIGIYKIENLINGKVYIGQSINIKNRWRMHKTELRNNSHANKHLQHSWNIHGENSFNFSVIENCNINELNDREKYWISYYDSYYHGYNCTIGGEGNSTLTKEIVKPICNMFNKGCKNPVDIANYFLIEPKKVRRYLCFGNLYNMCHYVPREIKNKKVICITTNKIFNSLKEAHQFYNIANITASCNHKLNYVGVDSDGTPLIWMYYNEYELLSENDIQQHISNILYKIDWRVICLETKEIFHDVYQAAKWCGLKTHQTILNNCLDKTKHAGRHPVTKEKLSWKYYKYYIIDNNIQYPLDYKII